VLEPLCWKNDSRFAERAIALHRKGGDVAAAVVGDEHALARGIDFEEARGRAACVLAIERLQIAPTTFNRESGDEIVLPTEFVDGIQEPLVRRERDEKRALHARGAFQRLQRAFFRIEAKRMNPGLFARSEGGDENDRFSSKSRHGEQSDEEREFHEGLDQSRQNVDSFGTV
jgi:hypothetical protein